MLNIVIQQGDIQVQLTCANDRLKTLKDQMSMFVMKPHVPSLEQRSEGIDSYRIGTALIPAITEAFGCISSKRSPPIYDTTADVADRVISGGEGPIPEIGISSSSPSPPTTSPATRESSDVLNSDANDTKEPKDKKRKNTDSSSSSSKPVKDPKDSNDSTSTREKRHKKKRNHPSSSVSSSSRVEKKKARSDKRDRDSTSNRSQETKETVDITTTDAFSSGMCVCLYVCACVYVCVYVCVFVCVYVCV